MTSRCHRSLRRASRTALRWGAALAASALVVACSVQVDSRPRDIDPDALPGVQQFTGTAGSVRPGETTRVFFLGTSTASGASRLRAVGRDTSDTPTDRLFALFLGPTSSEQALRIGTALAPGITARRVSETSPQTVTVDMPTEFGVLVGATLTDALAQIVYTATESNGVTEVVITVDGATREWPRGDGLVTSKPLTRFDFPDSNPTSEPDYPSVPSPD